MKQAVKALKYDEISDWSLLKLEILKKYASAYSSILTKNKLHHIYIDGFAGAGQHIVKRSKELVPGSPLNALRIEPPFKEVHLVDLDSAKVAELKKITSEFKHVHVHGGDANKILLDDVFPRVKYKDYRRALCVLDPYGMGVDWKVLVAAAQSETIEIFLNFSIMDMNMNALHRDIDGAKLKQQARMNEVWGDDSWRNACYEGTPNLFGQMEYEKQNNDAVAEAFQQRLIKVAGFKYVPFPVAMRNEKNAIVYYLFFASHKPVSASIVKQIFDRYRNQGVL